MYDLKIVYRIRKDLIDQQIIRGREDSHRSGRGQHKLTSTS